MFFQLQLFFTSSICRQYFCSALLLVFLGFLSPGDLHAATTPEQPSVAPQDYRLGAGDKISISVYDETELSMEMVVPGVGNISYPFLGDIKISGRTPKEVEDAITSGLKGAYLVDPKVTVGIVQYRPFFIHGEVKQSGGYPYQPGLNLRKAVTLAGGFTERANKSKILVIREKSTKQDPILIKMDDLVYPGDMITVEESLF